MMSKGKHHKKKVYRHKQRPLHYCTARVNDKWFLTLCGIKTKALGTNEGDYWNGYFKRMDIPESEYQKETNCRRCKAKFPLLELDDTEL